MEKNFSLRKLIDNLPTNWALVFSEFETDEIDAFLNEKLNQYDGDIDIYPKQEDVLRCFSFFNVEDTKVVLLGQDPYHGPNQATGLCFSVPRTMKKLPPSLKNIFKEIGEATRADGCLDHWAEQGVLMLNTALTVTQSKPNSHKDIWATFTDNVIKYLSLNCDDVIFVLWGANAQSKLKFIDQSKHRVLQSAHPLK